MKTIDLENAIRMDLFSTNANPSNTIEPMEVQLSIPILLAAIENQIALDNKKSKTYSSRLTSFRKTILSMEISGLTMVTGSTIIKTLESDLYSMERIHSMMKVYYKTLRDQFNIKHSTIGKPLSITGALTAYNNKCVFSEDELELFHSLQENNSLKQAYLYFFLFLCETGLRYNDAINAKEYDLCIVDGVKSLKVEQSMTKKTVYIPISIKATNVIWEMKKLKGINNILKYNDRVSHLIPFHVSYLRINEYVKDLVKRIFKNQTVVIETIINGKVILASVPRYQTVTLNSTRHTFISNRLKEGLHPETVAVLSGTSINRLNYYYRSKKQRKIESNLSKYGFPLE